MNIFNDLNTLQNPPQNTNFQINKQVKNDLQILIPISIGPTINLSFLFHSPCLILFQFTLNIWIYFDLHPVFACALYTENLIYYGNDPFPLTITDIKLTWFPLFPPNILLLPPFPRFQVIDKRKKRIITLFHLYYMLLYFPIYTNVHTIRYIFKVHPLRLFQNHWSWKKFVWNFGWLLKISRWNS